jgi:hypothetical protein
MKQLQTIIVCIFIFCAATAYAAPPLDISTVVAIKGNGSILRDKNTLDAKVKTGIQMGDTVTTAASSRMKMLFIDDSVLTLADNSSMAIKEFVHSKTDRGKSIFNLLDGKMLSVVGKTKFEVQTSTAVAAARGTIIYFETGMINGKHFTRITCLEGVVDIHSSANPQGPGATLTAGMTMMIVEGEPLPEPMPTSPSELSEIQSEQISGLPPVPLLQPTLPDSLRSRILAVDLPFIVPPVLNQQPQGEVKQPSTVTIGIQF